MLREHAISTPTPLDRYTQDVNTKHTTSCLAALALASTLLSACGSSTTSPRASESATIAAPAISAAKARAVTIFSEDGRPVEWSNLVSSASDADVVLVGENHGHPLGLAAAAALWEDMLPRSPRAALAMEFIERDEQSRLDDYLTGITDEATFRKRTNRVEGNYPSGHRQMIEAAKSAGRPVIAANAPRPYVRIARTSGFDKLASLTPEQKRLFRIPDEIPARGTRYRDDFDKIMTEDPGQSPPAALDPAADAQRRATLDATFRSQSMWDWTMADSVAAALQKNNAPVLLIVGRFHIDFEGGLAQALKHIHPGAKTVRISFVDAPAPTSGGPRDEDKARANYIIYVGSR